MTQRRELAAVEADLDAALERVAELRRERKSVVMAEKARRQHEDPAFEAAILAGRRKLLGDPSRHREWQLSLRRSLRECGRTLPPMTRAERLTYNLLRREKIGREEAIMVAMLRKPRPTNLGERDTGGRA